MNKNRLLLFGSFALLCLLVIGGILGALLRLINELRYSLEYLMPYWLVNPVLFISSVLIILIIIQFGWPSWKSFIKKLKQNNSDQERKSFVPRNKRHAASQSLESIDKLLEKLQDDVSKEALRQEKERVAKELARGDLTVVVFGTGSSGKTSLIRALLNEMVGEVKASMGSTSKSQLYRLRLKGLNRSLKLIDTPGILESGQDGRTREKEARSKASNADLIIVVVDSDLRSAELQVIKSLANLGKRILLVLNKCDLRGEEEINRLTILLCNHCKNLISEENIISTSAAPQSLPRPGKQPWQPPPEINLLLHRLARILHQDGEELLADNILLQCRNLGETGKGLLSGQRKKEALKCLDRYSWISSGVVAANPLPGADLVGTAAINAQMVMEIAKVYGIQLTRSRAQELTISVGKTLTGLGIVKGGVNLISTALTLNLPTLILGRAVQGIAAAWLTRVAGQSFITYFEQDQDWGDGGIQEVVQHHYELNRRETSLKNFMEIAIRRVVGPLQKNYRRQLPPRRMPREEQDVKGHEHQEQ